MHLQDVPGRLHLKYIIDHFTSGRMKTWSREQLVQISHIKDHELKWQEFL